MQPVTPNSAVHKKTLTTQIHRGLIISILNECLVALDSYLAVQIHLTSHKQQLRPHREENVELLL